MTDTLAAFALATFCSGLWQWIKSKFPRIDALDFGNWGGVGLLSAVTVTLWNAYVPPALRVLPEAGIEAQVLYITGLGVIGHSGKKMAENKLAKAGKIDRRLGETLSTWLGRIGHKRAEDADA